MSDRASRALCLAAVLAGCVPTLANQPRAANTTVAATYNGSTDETSSAQISWREFFGDPALVELIGLALKNNQELNIVALEIDIAQSEIMARGGEQLPKLKAKVGVGLDKVGRYTSQGVADEANGVPEHLPNFGLGLFASWEVDVWSKLRNATKAATLRYLASVEGKHFAESVLVGEIASVYYELLALDAQLEIVTQNLGLWRDSLEMVRIQKEAARATELAVKRFEAEVLKIESRRFALQQQVVEAENRLNFLVGRFPQPIQRDWHHLTAVVPATVHAGLPSQLLQNRPDVKRAELELAAAELDVKVARASFFPSLELSAAVGAQSFDALRLISTPASLLYNLAADVLAPLLNRQALTATYASANSKQMQAVFNYERAILKGFAEVGVQLSAIDNYERQYTLRAEAVTKLNEASAISSELFGSARADYTEVLLTRREALDLEMELIEAKKQQLRAMVSLYQALGGGWR